MDRFANRRRQPLKDLDCEDPLRSCQDMKCFPWFRLIMAGLFFWLGGRAGIAAELPGDAAGTALIGEARKAVAAWHAGEPASGAVLRVVYFHPSDREPLPDYAERLDRVLTDVSGFYRDGLRRFGVAGGGLPLEKKAGKLVLHVVQGKHPAAHYQHESGDETAAEIRAAVKGVFDLDREHVLVMYGLCRKEPDGRYVFDAPYYGRGTQAGGLCHAADCELLDPLLLTETEKRIVYTEHYYPRMEQTVAKFNSMYLGGTAHELGHGLGLPHDSGSAREQWMGTSLMGMGNLTYRQEVWGGGRPVYLSQGSALQLISHPLITGSNKGRWEQAGGHFKELKFTAQEAVVNIRGKAAGSIPPYAVVAYLWPASSRTDHGAQTFPVLVKEGEFSLALSRLKGGDYRLKLTALHVNGATTTRALTFTVSTPGDPDVDTLQADWNMDLAVEAVVRQQPDARQFLTDELIVAAPSPPAKLKLKVLRGIVDPPAPLDLASVREAKFFLSDAVWTKAEVGWGQPARNFFWFAGTPQTNPFLSLTNRIYDKGLYAHSPSSYIFPVAGQWKKFTATVGLNTGALAQGSAVFTVWGDGRELHRSPILRAGERREIELDITGVKELELRAEGGEGHPHNSWAIWADPVVSR